MKKRIDGLRELLVENELEAMIVNNAANRRYLSGFTGTAGGVLVTREEALLLTDFRYTEQAKEQAPDLEVREFDDKLINLLAELIEEFKIEKLGFEARELTYNQYLKYKENLDVELKGARNLVQKLRLVKDKAEIEKIKKAVKLADKAFSRTDEWLKPGVKEQEISLELEFFMKKEGASDKAFDFIVASGVRSSLPHGVASKKELKNGEFVKMDFGCVYEGYHSDITRTVVLGEEPTKKQREVYDLVLKAQEEALDFIEAGKTGKEVDKVARDVIKDAGYGDYFGHGLGHGVGLEIHEGPKLSWQDDTTLESGMVVSVEPGVYLPDWGGVRIEDLVVVKEDGCEILTSAPKELKIIK